MRISQNHTAKILISHKRILDEIEKIAKRINKDYGVKHPIFICVLNGAFYFMSDLLDFIDIAYDIDFIRLSSYRNKTESSGTVEVKAGLSLNIKDRDIIIVEDILDTGTTIVFLHDYLSLFKPKSIKVVSLLIKGNPNTLRYVDYYGFEICDEFVIGYGLDWKQKFRYLRGIYKITEN